MYFTENSYISIMQIEIFSKVKDPRVLGKVRHELEDVLRIALIGVLCSCDDYDEISDLIEDNTEEFKSMGFLKLSNGVSSGDTIRRVVEAVNPEQMRASLAICRDNIVSSLKGCHVIIDGKKLRGRESDKSGVQWVVYPECNGLRLRNMRGRGAC